MTYSLSFSYHTVTSLSNFLLLIFLLAIHDKQEKKKTCNSPRAVHCITCYLPQKVKKVNLNLEKAMKAQRGSRSLALIFL
jgi:hypothetical protein